MIMPAKKEEKEERKPDPETAMKTDAPVPPIQGVNVIGEPSEDKRLFQTNPETKEWLTQEEAEKKGFFWREEDNPGEGKKKKR